MTGRVSKSGYLRKVSRVHDGFSVRRPLLKRWVVLRHYTSHRDNVIISRLICFDDASQHNVSHEIDLADGTIIDVVEKDVGHLVNESAPVRKRKPAGYGFELVHRNKNCNITFIAKNDDLRREWMTIIRKKMKKSSKKELRFDLNNDVGSHETTTDVLRKENRDMYLRIEKLEAMCSRLRQELARYCPSDFINNLLQSFSPPVKRVRSAKQAAKGPAALIQRSITPESREVDIMCDLSLESDECKSASAIDPILVSISKLKTPRVSIGSMTRTKSANEFENDDLSSAHSATVVDDQPQLRKMNDICHRFQSVMHVDRLCKTLINEELVADSRFKLFSSAYSFTEAAGLLTKKHLYLISAVNHQIWTEFAARSRIDQFIPTENDHGQKITEAIAKKLGHNLDLIDDEQINAAMQQQLVGKTKKQLKLDILLHEKHIQSLACWFPALHATLHNSILRAQQLKEVKRIIIMDFYNVSIIAEAERDAFISSVMHANQAYDDQQRCGSDILITLQRYCTQSEIESLNERANAWIKQKRGSDANRIKIVAHDDTIKVTTSVVLSADIRSFADLRTAPNDKCSLALTDKQDGAYMWCTFESLNICQEWCTHLNSVMSQSVHVYSKLKHSSSSDQKNAEQPARERRLSNTSRFSEKIMNDFGAFDDDCIVDDEQQEHFGFGVYLNYWQEGFANSVKPRYPTLKDELCHNKIAAISDSDYEELYRDCVGLLRTRKHRMLADDIGVNNKRFRIRKGTPITLNHLIALKLMTDFTDVQNTFKKTCRKKHANETMTQLVQRNAECAHWCRYIKEACTFYGKRMKKNTKWYTGLTQKLLFSSMKQHFECPISTTTTFCTAQNFCKDNGVILTLKAANSRARYFDVSWLSAHRAEEERLIMGSSLEICDIYVNGTTRKAFGKSVFSAISLFERLTNGQFIPDDIESERVLFELLQNQLCATYISDLFANLVKTMRTKHENGKLWLNKDEIAKLQCDPLRNLFTDEQLFESRFKLDPLKPIRYVQQYEWQIEGDQLKHFNALQPRQYLSSNKEYQYQSLMATINFNLKCCAKYSEASNKTGLFLHITKMQSNVRSVLLGCDIFCDAIGKKNYEHSILPQWMDKNKQHCGLQMFKCEPFDAKTAPNESSSITWKIALKIIDVKYEK